MESWQCPSCNHLVGPIAHPTLEKWLQICTKMHKYFWVVDAELYWALLGFHSVAWMAFSVPSWQGIMVTNRLCLPIVTRYLKGNTWGAGNFFDFNSAARCATLLVEAHSESNRSPTSSKRCCDKCPSYKGTRNWF
eukprot:5385199-Amphidinium_carterae.1